MFLVRKGKFWYARENVWRNGKSQRAWEEYLGTADDIYRKVKGSPDMQEIQIKSYPFGKIAAVLSQQSQNS